MKSLLAILFLAAVLFGAWWLFFKTDDAHESAPKQESIPLGKHTPAFNQSISNSVNSYLDMKSAFVDADTFKVKSEAQKFIGMMNSVKLDDLQKEDSQIVMAAQQEISDIKANAQAILMENDITEMRQDFRMVSENLYPFLRTIGYEGEKLYWQNCPMAFGEGKEGNWLSDTKEIINPYLGKHDPQYKASMLNCGEIKDTIK
ncbi:MAG: DUF3347 domain-containing protein [Bacteroidota bacterium]|nr:DUF3347 domain-containing protein [Bacteroidota bacterium]